MLLAMTELERKVLFKRVLERFVTLATNRSQQVGNTNNDGTEAQAERRKLLFLLNQLSEAISLSKDRQWRHHHQQQQPPEREHRDVKACAASDSQSSGKSHGKENKLTKATEATKGRKGVDSAMQHTQHAQLGNGSNGDSCRWNERPSPPGEKPHPQQQSSQSVTRRINSERVSAWTATCTTTETKKACGSSRSDGADKRRSEDKGVGATIKVSDNIRREIVLPGIRRVMAARGGDELGKSMDDLFQALRRRLPQALYSDAEITKYVADAARRSLLFHVGI